MNTQVISILHYFAGIGSRETPACVGLLMYYISQYLTSEKGYALRSGGAIGADSFFEKGVIKSVQNQCEIFMPKKVTSKYGCKKIHVSSMSARMESLSIIESNNLHEDWNNLINNPSNNYAVGCHLRNVFQILGDLSQANPVMTKLVCCWTPDGAKTTERTSKKTGGTRTAIRLANIHDIPVLNLANRDDVLRIHNKVKHLYTARNTPNINEILSFCH